METLDTTGFLVTEIAGEWNVLSADFGDGFEAAATVGAPEGTRVWTIKIDALTGDLRGGLITDALEPAFILREDGSFMLREDGGQILQEQGSTRAQYLWRFFRISKANANQPFWFEAEDPDDGRRKLFLASFTDNRLSYTVLCAKVYSTGLMLRQRRLRDVMSPVLAES